MGAHLSRTPTFREPRTSFENFVETREVRRGARFLGRWGTEEIAFHSNAVTRRNQTLAPMIYASKACAVGDRLLPALTLDELDMTMRTGLYR